MRTIKIAGSVVAALVVCMLGTTNALAAARFTASATGSLAGKAIESQIFSFNGGSVKCNSAAISGTITQIESTEQHVTVHYTSCIAFATPVTHVSDMTVRLTADGTVHLLNTATITVTAGIFGECTITITPQTLSTMSYINVSGGKLKTTPHLTGIVYHSTGGICGSAGTNGTYTGDSEVESVGGGSVAWDKE